VRRYYVLFFINVNTREVIYAGITTNPTGAWTTQAARNMFITHSERLEDARALVRHRGSQFTASFDEIFRTQGLKIVKTPVRSPVANTFVERWIGSIRRELLKQPEGLPAHIIWNQRQLERLVVGYIGHHNTHRPHQSLNQRPLTPPDQPPTAALATVTAIRTSRCDGLINEYQRAA
jgi:transposase InsO family protein